MKNLVKNYALKKYLNSLPQKTEARNYSSFRSTEAKYRTRFGRVKENVKVKNCASKYPGQDRRRVSYYLKPCRHEMTSGCSLTLMANVFFMLVYAENTSRNLRGPGGEEGKTRKILIIRKQGSYSVYYRIHRQPEKVCAAMNEKNN